MERIDQSFYNGSFITEEEAADEVFIKSMETQFKSEPEVDDFDVSGNKEPTLGENIAEFGSKLKDKLNENEALLDNIEKDTAIGVIQGADAGLKNTLYAPGDIIGAGVDFVNDKIVKPVLNEFGIEGSDTPFGGTEMNTEAMDNIIGFINDITPNFLKEPINEFADQPFTFETYGNLVKGFSQFGIVAIPAAQIVGYMSSANSLVRAVAWSGISDFTAMNPDDPAIAKVLLDYFEVNQDKLEPWATNAIAVLEKHDTDGVITKRLKNFQEGVIVGAFADTAMLLIRGVLKASVNIPWKGLTPLISGGSKALTLGANQLSKGFKIVKTKLGEIITPPPPTVNPIIDNLPILSADSLVGKKIFPIQADLTKAGGEYKGIDSSQIDIPIILQGGPDFPILQSSKDGKVVWAVDSKSVSSGKLNKDADYALVVSMAPDSHKSNATVNGAMIETSLAYLRDGRITDDIINAVDAEIRLKFPEFPGLKSENVAEFTRGLGFEQRKILMDALSNKTAQQGGFPNLQAVLDATVDPAYSGLNSNDSIMILKINKDGGAVRLGEGNTQKHMSYEFGLKGEPVGRIPMVNARKMFPDWFKQRDADVAQMEKTGLGMDGKPLQRPPNTARAFQFNLPVEEITQKKADAIKAVIIDKVKSPLQAKLVVAAMEGKWSTTSGLKKDGSITALNWIREARSSPEGITLSIPKGANGERLNDNAAAAILQEEIKRGELVIYQLGKVAKDAKGKNDSRTLFGIRKNYNYTKEYDGIITNPNYKGPGFNDNDKALVSVLSNDKSANGIGKATVLKAIEEGVTVLDCYAVKTDKYRNGFLPQFYKQFGFQVAGTVPFNKEFAPKGKEWDDLVKVWKDRGWDGNVDNGPYPDIIIMKYIGGENSRATATRNFVQDGAFRIGEGDTNGVFQGAIRNAGQLDGSGARGSRQRSDTNNRATDTGNVRNGDGSSSTDRLAEVGRELLSATKEQVENLGIDYSRILALKAQMAVK